MATAGHTLKHDIFTLIPGIPGTATGTDRATNQRTANNITGITANRTDNSPDTCTKKGFRLGIVIKIFTLLSKFLQSARSS
ncbi:hypothetical protein [Aliamphritea spongicola]|nr:hypothetical protein [Aliamphritea spongicola]